jgi:diadenylate cyclase
MTDYIPDWAYVLLQLLILVCFIYFVYNKYIKKSQAEKLLKGLFVILMSLIISWAVSKFFSFTIFEVLFGACIQLIVIGLIVIFQPELRRMLLYLGQPELFGRNPIALSSPENQMSEYLIHELTESAKYLSKSKTGALIVLESPNTIGEYYLEVGTTLDAVLSTELLLTIFHPKTPLHDGAVIISPENRIVSAGVLLPLTEDPKLSWQYGTRHRAAIGLAEVTDSHCIVISEETGTISLVYGSHIEKMAHADDLKKRLEKIYHVSPSSTDAPTKISSIEKLTGFFASDTLPSSLQKLFHRREVTHEDRTSSQEDDFPSQNPKRNR